MTIRALLAALVLLSGTACNFDKLLADAKGPPTVLTDESAGVQLTVPPGWVKDQLNDLAKIQASRRISEEYIMVISESKEDFGGMTIDKYSKITRDTMTAAMTNIETGPAQPMTINGLPALRYELRGTVDGLNVVYLHTIVETLHAYHQVIAWTLKSKFEKNKENLAKVAGTFVATPVALQPKQPKAPPPSPASGKDPLVLKDENMGVQLTVPPGWVKSNDPGVEGPIQANRDGDAYVMVVSESKEDFADMTLTKFSEVTVDALKSSLTDVKLGKREAVKVGDRAGVRVEVSGALDGLNLVYVHTSVETPKAYHQVVAWSVKSKYEANKAELIKASSALDVIK